MKREQKAFIISTFIAVITLGLCSTAILLFDPPMPYTETAAPLVDLTKKVTDRIPTSVDSASLEEKVTPIEFKCDSDKQDFETKQPRVQVVGTFCESAKGSVAEVFNKTNGYMATVLLNGNGFTTDLINLKTGINTVEITIKSQKNESKKILQVVRR